MSHGRPCLDVMVQDVEESVQASVLDLCLIEITHEPVMVGSQALEDPIAEAMGNQLLIVGILLDEAA